MNKAAKLVLRILAATFGSLALIFAVGAWRLSSGPISIGFLSPYIEKAFEAEDLSYHVEFEDTILTWAGWDRSLDILVVNARAIDASGNTLAVVPEISLGLSGLALLQGVVAPTSVELLHPKVYFARTADGEFNFGFGSDTEAGDEAVDNLVADFLKPPEDSHPLGRLKRVSVLGARLTVDDAVTNTTWEAPKADIVLDLDKRSIRGDFSLDVDIDGALSHVSGKTYFDRQVEETDASIQLAGIVPAHLSDLYPELAPLKALQMPVAGELIFTIGADGSLTDGVRFDLTAGKGELLLPDVFPKNPNIEIMQVRGEVDKSLKQVRIDDFFVDVGGPSMTFAGLIDNAEAGLGINGTVNVTDMPFDALRGYWPENLIPSGRQWILANVSDGMMTRFGARLDLKPGEFGTGESGLRDEAISADFEFENATINYLNEMPKVRGVNGTGRIRGETMSLDMRDGSLGELHAPTGEAHLRNIASDNPTIAIKVKVEGPAQAAVALLDRERLGYPSKMGFHPDQFQGNVSTTLAVEFPLLLSVTFDDFAVAAVAHLTDLEVDDLFGDFDVSDGDLNLTLGKEAMEIDGNLSIEGMPAKIKWHENLGEKAPYRSRYEVSAVLDEAAQNRFGLLLQPYAKGPFQMNLVYTEDFSDRRRAAVALNARDVEMHIPELFWSKPVGKEANIHLLAELPEDGSIDIRSFELISRTLRADGQARISPELTLDNVDVARLVMGSTDINARIQQSPEGKLSVQIGGESLDLRPYIKELFERGAGEMPPFVLEADVKRLITRADQQITNARARVVNTEKRLDSVYLAGTLVTGKRMRVRVDPAGAERRLVVQSDDAGSVARAFDIYDNAIGGRLVLEATLHDDQPGTPITGEVAINDYRVINAPTLARILNIASFTGALEVLQGEGVSFETFQMPFKLNGDVLTVSNARTSGPSIGINAEGTVNLATEETNIHGTIVPAYSLNSVLGSIPLLGDLLVGGEGEGIFAATYTVSGNIEEPTVVVNPLAALAPGVLRNIFSIFDGVPRQDDGKAPPQPEFKR